jgi:Ca-activated chloride channel family protein
MKFVNTQYLTYAIVVIIVIGIILNRLNAQFFKWVKSYWFFDRTWASRISTFLYTISLFLMMTALLDLRGPEKKIKASIPDQRTILLIDSSTSMLAEDVRPNRFVKSLQLARHFVKNSAGHQISIVLFSDIQKRLIPFTDDIDLIDSRLAALEKTNSVAGGSNISQGIEEAIQYFEFDSSDDDKSKSGNMLIFTDAEESEGAFKVNIPSNINIAVVGVGTLKGANIPLRFEDGGFRGYKTFKGEPVTTKLDEDYIRKMGKGVKNYKYWIANSFSLPTDEITNFFRTSFTNKQTTGDLRVRPVFSHYILIPAILLYCLSVLVGRFAIFKVSRNLVVVFVLLLGLNSHSEAQDDSTKTQVQTTPEIKKDLEFIQEGKADREYVLKTAEKMLKAKDDKRATELYSEYAKKDDSEEVRFNQATSLLKSKRLKEAMPIIQDLMKNSKNEELKDKLRKNLRLNVEQKKKEKEEKKDEKKDEKKEDKQDEKKDQKKDDNKEKEDKKDGKQGKEGKQQDKQQDKQQGKPEGKDGKAEDQKQGKPENKQDQKEDKKGEKEKEKKDKGEGKEEDKKEDKEDEKQDTGPKTIEEKEKEIEQKRRMTKTPAMIKQIMSDDRDLQKKMMDTSTNARGEQKPKRDW